MKSLDEIKRKNKKRGILKNKEKEELMGKLKDLEKKEKECIRKEIESSKCNGCEWGRRYGRKIYCMFPRCVKE